MELGILGESMMKSNEGVVYASMFVQYYVKNGINYYMS